MSKKLNASLAIDFVRLYSIHDGSGIPLSDGHPGSPLHLPIEFLLIRVVSDRFVFRNHRGVRLYQGESQKIAGNEFAEVC
jgi:hypothetical protein